MKFFTTHRRMIALVVTVAFAWLLQVSAMPLAAAGSEEAVAAAGEQAPSYYEAPGNKPAAKKSIVPLVLVGVGVVAAVVVLMLVLKTSYDIVGDWEFKFVGPTTEYWDIRFSGDKKSGNWVFIEIPGMNGTYKVDGKKATMELASDNPQFEFYGEFTGKDSMSGKWTNPNGTWSWTATRGAGDAAVKPAPQVQSKLFTR